jgi:outer membrane PBP1 activator LpoA protein
MKIILHRIRSLLFVALLPILISACSSVPEPVETVADPVPQPPTNLTQQLVELASRSNQPQANAYLIEAMELLLDSQQIDEITELQEQVVDAESLGGNLRTRLVIVAAEVALIRTDPQTAIGWLTGELVDDLDDQRRILQQRIFQQRVQAYNATNQPRAALNELVRLTTSQLPNRFQSTQDQIWQTLELLSDSDLELVASNADSYELRGWIELARLIRAEQFSIQKQIEAIARWRGIWTSHSAITQVPQGLANLELVWQQRPKHIALLLPLQDQVGVALQEGFLSAYYQALEMDIDVPQISVFDTSGLSEVAGIYDTAVQSGADLIIGPQNKDLVQQLNNMPSLPVTTLALNYTDLQTRSSPNFYQFGLAPRDEIAQAAKLAWSEGHRNVAIVSPSSNDYQQLQQEFANYWRDLGGELVSSASFSGDNEYADLIRQLLAIDASEARAEKITDILPRNEVEFTPRRRGDIDFIFLMANPRQGRQIKPTLAFYFAGDIPVYALPAINDGTTNQILNQDLNGIIFPDSPWVLADDDQFKQQVESTLRAAQGPIQRLRALGIDSFQLYPRLSQFANNEISNFAGMTGTLTLSSFGSFQRTPQSAVFVDGIAVQYGQETSSVTSQTGQ